MTEFKRILLVEDNRNDLELTLMALAECNLANKVDIARDGEEALDYLNSRGKYVQRAFGNPAVIMLDLKLPKVNGFEVLKQIKESPLLKLIPVVILTSSKEDRDIMDGYSCGANAYVVKPVDFVNFVRAIKELGLFWAVTNVPPSIC